MPKKCPPGIVCFENHTLIYIMCFTLLIMYLAYLIYNKKITFTTTNTTNNNSSYQPQYREQDNSQRRSFMMDMPNNLFGLLPRPGFSYTNTEQDVLLNPYAPPLRDTRYMQQQSYDVRGGIPINVSTRAVDTNYRQVGLLKRLNGPEMMLPLMGRPLYTNRDKWQFYTMSDKNNMLKLPISFKGKSCTNEYGCDDVSNGDTVYVEGINDAFSVTLYDNAINKYLPFV
jgi:hypothetical protein